MTLSDSEKLNFIKNNFHQYFDLELNTNIETSSTVNLIISVDTDLSGGVTNETQSVYEHDTSLPDESISTTLSKYEKVTYKKEECIQCVCTEVIDGDTIWVKIATQKGDTLTYETKKVRLVGVNTPESGRNGYEESKIFLEKVCYSDDYFKKIEKQRLEEELTAQEESIVNNKQIYLRIDKVNPYEQTEYSNTIEKRLLAILIVDERNINEVLLKEKLAEIQYVPPSEFYPFDWGDSNTRVHVKNFSNDDIYMLSPYLRPDMTNIVFTPKNGDEIYRYEYYKGVFYVKLNPFSKSIRMHILPKGYDCSNTVLIFKDDMLEDKNIRKTNDYKHFSTIDNNFINSYYLESNQIRDRNNISEDNREYKPSDWTNTYFECFYDISENTKSMENLMICSCYNYNNSSPFYSIHYTGVRDKTNLEIKDRATLIDAIYENIVLNKNSNHITKYQINSSNQLYIPKNPPKLLASYPNNIDHTTEVGILKKYRKKIKYINDSLYTEENIDHTCGQLKRYALAQWKEKSS